MLQLNNTTPFATSMSIFPNELGIETLYIIVKSSFNIGRKWTLLDKQIPVQEQDIYWTEPEKSSLKYASDFHTGKPATDIIMIGNALTPDNKDATELDVSLSINNNIKTVRVFGNRLWKNKKITSPTPFKNMPLVYEKAYGGLYIINGEVHSAENRNPVGRGFAGIRNAKEMDNVPLPNLEDPENLISHHQDQPVPACFSFCSPGWLPRSLYAGTYDDKWQQSCAPYLPFDFDSQFLNMAHPDMIVNGYLEGGETVHISNMNSSGNLNFKLPKINLISNITIDNKKEYKVFNMETLILEPNLNQLSMVWRTSVQCDKKALKISEIDISMEYK